LEWIDSMKAALAIVVAIAAMSLASISLAADTAPDLVALQASDPSMSVQALYTKCTATDLHHQMYCAGFFTAEVDSMMVLGAEVSTKAYGICPKTAISAGAAAQAFKNWAQKHPEAWSLQRYLGALWALQEVWPCR
jgi:hypothetical protein